MGEFIADSNTLTASDINNEINKKDALGKLMSLMIQLPAEQHRLLNLLYVLKGRE